MEASQTDKGQIPLIFIHGSWLSASSWETYADYFGKRGFAVSAPEWPRKQGAVEEMRENAEASAGRPHLHMVAPEWQEVAAAIDSWLDGALDAPEPATHQAS